MLFPDEDNIVQIAPEAFLLKGFLLGQSDALLQLLSNVIAANPLRHMATPNGYQMSAAMTNCGEWGWVSDEKGYRYSERDPVTNELWQPMPIPFVQLAISAASAAGFDHFTPDACLINRYAVGAAMSLHQDKNESDFTQPIVSFSLGLPAMFDFGGVTREAPKLQFI